MLNDFLKPPYIAIPLRQTMFGHLELTATINGVQVLFLLDTGAASTVIDMAFALEHHWPLLPSEVMGGGVGTSELTLYQLDIEELNFENFAIRNITIYAADLSHVKQSLSSKGETLLPCGVIGGDILMQHRGIIDYPGMCLYLR